MITVAVQRGRRPGPSVTRRTGPLACLQGKRILVVADGQNLDLGSKDLGCKLDWSGLHRRLQRASDTAWFHVIFARGEGDTSRSDWFTDHGWTPAAKTRRWLFRRGGKQLDANADNLVAFQVGALVSRLPVELVVVGTGDGQLAEDLAEAIRTVDSRCEVATLSLAGSTAARLDCRSSRLIDANIEIGRDCLIPIQIPHFAPTRGGGEQWNG